MQDHMTLTGVLDQINTAIDGQRVPLGQIIASLEQRGFGPLLLAPALIAMLPTGAIPGVPSLCGATIVLISIQLGLGRTSPWLPAWLRRREIDRGSFERSYRLAKPFTTRVDRFIYPRWRRLTSEPAPRVLAMASALLAVMMVPLELLPFAAAMPASAIAFLGLGLSARDGLVVLVGLAAAVGATLASAWLWF